jgi:hypothetical protein
MKNAYRSLSANLKGRDYSGDLDVDVVLKWILIECEDVNWIQLVQERSH